MSEKSAGISDKATLIHYCKLKEISWATFVDSLGFSDSFLNGEGKITLDELKKIKGHPDYKDLNVDSLLKGDVDNIRTDKGKLFEGIANQKFIVDALKKINEVKNDEREMSHLTKELCTMLDQSLEIISSLSEEYTSLYTDYQRVAKALKKEGGL